MSENIEKVEKNEKTSEVSTDNVVLYPVSDNNDPTVSTSSRPNAASVNTTADIETADATSSDTVSSDTTSSDTASSDTANTTSQTSSAHADDHADDHTDDITDDDLEEDFYEQQEKSRSKDEHPFREFFSNFRSKRKIEMNRDELILSRISDDDLMEYLRMEQKRMELLQQAKEVREKRFWTTFQLFICLLSVVLVIYFLKDNPVILVTILYTLGILAALRIWSKAQDVRDNKDGKDSAGQHKKPWK